MKVTLHEVAARAGVSIASVSRALNGEIASARTIELVTRAAAELGYIPDQRARSLKLGATRQLTFAVADVGNPVYVQMLRAVEDAVRESGYRVLISSTRSSVEAEIELLQSLLRRHSDGLVISPLRVTEDFLTALDRLTIPAVVIGRLPDDHPYDIVRTDSAAGVDLAIDHLIGSGRRTIGFLNGPTDTTPGSIRGQAFAAALARTELPAAEEHRATAADFTFADGLTAATELLDRAPGLDAVLAANDLLAAAVLHAAHRHGLRVPEDLAVIGMDDSELASQLMPTLTSVSLGSAERGRRAAELLLARIADPSLPAQQVIIPPELIIRDSAPS
ncbi:LacI family DNA-binding transcriptional regulator [Microlunatus speluncae]|uniref:LacI family DNA-binding transcriptional regulator n=1 Tax=Microlunatus speluncae TaxID=2594267 RepID=UPI0012663283|nr:LacI family DNA-binding transcriptional regulator [Microlunatus speluncae]